MTLTEWLRAQLAEDERVALAAANLQFDPENGWGTSGDHTVTPHIGRIHEDEARQHIVTWDPARVLAEVKAKRAILDMDVDEIGDCCPDCGDYAADKVHGVAVHLLAQPYADREGWRAEWSVS